MRGLCWSWILASSAYPLLRCWNWPYKIIFSWNLYPDVYCDRKILHQGVGVQMLTSLMNFPYIQGSYMQGFLQSGVLAIRGLTIKGSYNQGSYNQGFLQSRVYISVSYMTHLCPVIDINRCSLYSGVQMNLSYMTGLCLHSLVQMNVYYMTSLCPDVDIDRKILWSGVRVDRKLLHLKRIGCSDVDIDLTMSHPC